MMRGMVGLGLVLGLLGVSSVRGEDTPGTAPTLERQVLPLLKARCVKCHGPARREAKLSLATPRGLARGGKSGGLVVPGQPEDSLIWARIADEEMPPKDPLPDQEKALLKRWIESGAAGLPTLVAGESEKADHWAFAPLHAPAVPEVRDTTRVRGPIDRFLQSALEAEGLGLGPEADRVTILRRVSFDLTGLPPTPAEVAAFLADERPDAYERLVERCLASPRYGERWGKYWLDASGYADSNGYFDIDVDRPLAYRYRDFVIRSWNQDRPLDQALREQLAGDELSGFKRGDKATPETIDLLVATHFLRNAQDGTTENDGNPDVQRSDRFAVLEGVIEVLGSSVFGMTFQCARCHDHKFEPISQLDYYQLQAILYPAYPVEKWIKPTERFIDAPLPEDLANWEARAREVEAKLTALKAEFRAWIEENREKGKVLFRDDFDNAHQLAPRWSTAEGSLAVHVDSDAAPAASVKDGVLHIIESGAAGDRLLSTAQSFDWTPDQKGGWIQVSFDLVDRKLNATGTPAERVGYYIARHNSLESGKAGGNLLLDGNPAGGANVFVGYPGPNQRALGTIGKAGYQEKSRYGVRVTNQGDGNYRLDHLVDWVTEGKPLILKEADLPDGGFGFEYCCGRSFVVDRVLIEASDPPAESANSEEARLLESKKKAKRGEYVKGLRALEQKRSERPGRIAWLSDLSATPPDVHLLKRGNYFDRGPVVSAGVPSVLCDPDNPFEVQKPFEGAASTGRRLALARWLTRPGSRPAALVARVTANRIWQYHFGSGLVATPENLGYSGAAPSNPSLLEYLAQSLIESGWSAKAMHRLIVNSAAYRQSSLPIKAAAARDPDNRLLWRYPMRRLDAEAVRDAMLAASGELDLSVGGPYVPVKRKGTGDALVDETTPGAHRRSVFLQQRRTSVIGMLEVFDSPSIVTTCTQRNSTANPLQSLSLLNSDFVVRRARSLAHRIQAEAGPEVDDRIALAFTVVFGRKPNEREWPAARQFIREQPERYQGRSDAADRTWADFCQMILASNPFLYVE